MVNKMDKLNVLFLNSWYPNQSAPFNGNFIQQHARAVALNCNVACLYVETREQKELFEISSVYNEGVFEVIVYTKNIKSTLFLAKKIGRRHKAYKKGLEIIKENFTKIDVTHLNVVLPAGLFALYLKKYFKIPFIITEHSTSYLKNGGIKHRFFERLLIKIITKKASRICPVSKDLKDAMLASGYVGDYAVIPNVVNTKYFKYKDSENLKPIKILHVSSLKEAHKNGRGLLRVIKQLSNKRTDFIFTIITDGGVTPITNYAKEIRVNKDFLYIYASKTTKEIALEMQKTDLFLLFSNYENLPCVISESLVSGVPVVSSDVGGITEMISSENGALVTARNEDELLATLETTLDNLSQFNRREISEKAKEKYGYSAVSDQFLSIYKEIIKT
jgi:glycosyltransferase involved in cell wall biosynthesis